MEEYPFTGTGVKYDQKFKRKCLEKCRNQIQRSIANFIFRLKILIEKNWKEIKQFTDLKRTFKKVIRENHRKHM